jgi:hypothetical protein
MFPIYSIIAKIAHFQTAITLRFYEVNSCFKVSLQRVNIDEFTDVVVF